MQLRWRTILTLGLSLFCLASRAQHTQAELILADQSARPGDTVMAGVHLKMDPAWHTYWRNSGDSGEPTEIHWQLPPGITAGQIQWPLPKKESVADITGYIYYDEVVLLVPLTLAPNLTPGPLQLNAHVTWLECAQICVPGKQDVSANLTIGAETKPSADATTIATWEKKVPAPDVSGYSDEAWWEGPANGDTRALLIERRQSGDITATAPLDDADFFPDASADGK